MPSPSASPSTPLDTAIAALIRGSHRDPFAVLGPHRENAGIVVRAFQPAARAIDLRLVATGELMPMTKRDAGRSLRASNRRRGRRGCVSRLPAAHHVSRRPRRRDRRSVPLRPRAHRLRSASARRGDAPPRVREARRASHHRRHDHRRALRGVGAERRSRQRHRRLQRLGRARPPDAAAGARRASGRSSSPIWPTARSTSSRSARAPARS